MQTNHLKETTFKIYTKRVTCAKNHLN